MGAATARIASCVASSRAAATFSSIAIFPSTRLLMLTSQPCHVAAKTRTGSLSSLSLIRTKPLTTSVNCSPKCYHFCQHRTTENTNIRWFASGSHDKQQQKTSTGADREETAPSTISGSSQHDTWVEFQRSISVSGVDTGQIVKERTLGKKNRGGNIARKRKEREAEMVAQLKGVDNVIQLKGGEFPPLRYSDEETERLLAEAYAAIPPRAGKRGTLHIKREKRRWWIKRQYDYKKKLERIETHHRRMAKRMLTKAQMKEERLEAADVRKREKAYHKMVFRRWAEMNGHSQDAREVKMIEQ